MDNNEIGIFVDWVVAGMDNSKDKFVLEEWLYSKVREWYTLALIIKE